MALVWPWYGYFGYDSHLGQVTLPNHRHARISGIFDRETIVINVDGTIVALMTTRQPGGKET